jgi:hypothetical protein
MDDWNQIDQKSFYDNNGGGLLRCYYNHSPLAAVVEILNNHKWEKWKIKIAPHAFWKNENNRREFMEWLGNELKFTSMEDWYQISVKSFHDNNGGTY